jgi:glycosyltransferase involved in cell wall biosynthesis
MSSHFESEPKPELIRPPRALHVAALPFPTYQGTQAAIRAMLDASSRIDPDAALFTYATEGYSIAPEFAVHRVGNLPRIRSLRSGPSLGKLVLDARMLFELRALTRRLRPSVIVAHHVEAAALALCLREPKVVFFAHTDLAEELPVYGHPLLSAALRRAGGSLDRLLVQRTAAVAAISETLRARLSELRSDVQFVPVPWEVPEPIRARERAASRLALGIGQRAKIALYAGNLDAYQGVETVPRALAALRRNGVPVGLLLATQSDARTFSRSCELLEVPLHQVALGDERVRRQVHAAADLAIVPRLAPSGLPIKLLDALARGVPCAVMPRACAGLPLDGVVERAHGDSPAELARAIQQLIAAGERRSALAVAGRAYVAREHSQARFLKSLDAVIRSAIGSDRRS